MHCAGSPDHDLLAAGAHHGVKHDQGHGEEVTLGAVVTIDTTVSKLTNYVQTVDQYVAKKYIKYHTTFILFTFFCEAVLMLLSAKQTCNC